MKKILSILIGLALFTPQSAPGCTIPVFRFALEKWDLTTYEILVYHRGPLPADLQKALDQLNALDREALEMTHGRLGSLEKKTKLPEPGKERSRGIETSTELVNGNRNASAQFVNGSARGQPRLDPVKENLRSPTQRPIQV